MGSKQHIQNTGNSDLKILCIVYPMWRIEDEEVSRKHNIQLKLIIDTD